jgi:hypothetical protein
MQAGRQAGRSVDHVRISFADPAQAGPDPRFLVESWWALAGRLVRTHTREMETEMEMEMAFEFFLPWRRGWICSGPE